MDKNDFVLSPLEIDRMCGGELWPKVLAEEGAWIVQSCNTRTHKNFSKWRGGGGGVRWGDSWIQSVKSQVGKVRFGTTALNVQEACLQEAGDFNCDLWNECAQVYPEFGVIHSDEGCSRNRCHGPPTWETDDFKKPTLLGSLLCVLQSHIRTLVFVRIQISMITSKHMTHF